MNSFRKFALRLGALFLRNRFEAEMADELRAHLEMQAAANRAAGMPPDEAHYAARRQFGPLDGIKEQARDQRGWVWLEQTWKDFRYALRSLRRSPGFTTVAVLSLAVGIGVNSTLFSALDATFLRPLPFKNADEIVRFHRPQFSYPEYEELRAATPSLASLAAVSRHGALLQGTENSELLSRDLVSPDYFGTLGIAPAAGRLFSAGTDRSSQSGVVISYGLWQRRFGGDPHLVGQTIPLNMRLVTVLGVAAKGFTGDKRVPVCNLWQLAEAQRDVLGRSNREFELLGRLKPGATAAQVQAEVEIFVARAMPDLAKTADGRHVVVQSETASTRENATEPLLVMAVVGLVLLVACANVSVLLLARHEERRRELAVRLALGSSRRRLIRMLLVESVLLSLLGAAAGLALTLWGVSLVPALLPPTMSAHVLDLRVDGRVVGLTLGLSCLATMAFGLLPAWRATRIDVGPLLKSDTSPTLGGTHWFTVRNVLVVGQVAVALVFLAVAALFIRGFGRGQQSDFGFTQKNLLLAMVALNGGQQGIGDCEQLQERLRALPGVRAVSAGSWAPLAISGGGATVHVMPPGNDAPTTSRSQPVKWVSIEPGYFGTLGIRLLRGRDFTARDDGAGTRVAIISEAMAKRYWPDEDPVGQILRAGDRELAPREIVGIVRDLVDPRRPGAAPEPCLYLPLRQEFRNEVRLLVAPQGNPAALAGLVRNEIRRFNNRLMLIDVTTMGAQLRMALSLQWVGAWLGGVLGLLAFVLAVSGLYGVVTYAVSRRTRELGIRLALGARPIDALWLVLRQGLTLGVVGVGLGLPAAVAAGIVLRGALFGIGPADPVALATASLLVVAVALLACYLPARRASRVDPLVALRAE
jgi:predicted permease